MNIGIIGSGSWGITIAKLLISKGYTVTVWCRSEKKASRLRSEREDPDRLPGIKIPESIEFTTSFRDIEDSEYILFVVPSHTLRDVALNLKKYFEPTKAVSLIKGLEEKTFLTPSQILKELFLDSKIAVLSGPTIAMEVAKELPASCVAASEDIEYAKEIQSLFHTKFFRVYYSTDIIGVELGGALKNIIAIAAGIIDGLGLGANAKGALLVRGIREIMRMGEKPEQIPLLSRDFREQETS